MSQIIRMPRPNEKQALAFLDRHRYVAYGGARGGGKSWFVRWKAILLAWEYPGIRVLITRRTCRALLNNQIMPMKAILGKAARYNAGDRVFYFPNGSTVWFGYCDGEGDLDQYQGAEYDVWFADEAGQMQPGWIQTIDACVRGANDFPKRTYFTLNPGGPGHNYFKRLFVDREFLPGEDPEDYSFIQARLWDNQVLLKRQPQYRKSLEKLPKKLRLAWLEGRWDVFQGQFFEEFQPREDSLPSHVIAPFDPPDSWQRYRSYDWGYSKPFSCGWWVCSPEGVLYRIRELYGCTGVPDQGVRWTVEEQMEKIRQIEDSDPWLRGHSVIGVADPAIWDGSRGKSIAQTAAEFGLHFVPGIHQRIPGWMQLRRRLQFDREGKAGLYVFSGCKDFIRTLSALRFDPQRPEDLDTRGEDHIADETRYLCMLVPLEAKPLPQEEKIVIFGGKE